ncbi:MAG: hypothetical protein J0L88_06910 [Xanthomonadales bacterium]|nr:hypothetical protein [Xanthomonadales bacterium]
MITLPVHLLPRALVLGVAMAVATPVFAGDAAPADGSAATPQLWAAWGGTVGVRWNRELAPDLGLRIGAPATALDGLSWMGHERFALRQAGSLEFRVANNNLQGFVEGSVQARGGYRIELADGGSIDLSDFRLRPRAGAPLILDLVGADGKAWFYIDRLMYELVDDNHTLAVRAMDLRISRELAERLGKPQVADWAIADMEMTTEVLRQGAGVEPTGGGSYYWAGTPATRPTGEPQPPPGAINEADLFMSTFSAQQMRCQPASSCNGSSNAVVFAPSSTLKNNVNNGTAVETIPGDPLGKSTALWTADIPWYEKFSGVFDPYANDQHPYLIWNMYRVNADGGIDQIGRSGVKHAFLTTNGGCAPGHGTNSHVLGRQCSDTYGTGNNDSSNALGPRSEIIPATNVWGRCGSIYDTNCDGTANSSGNTQYSQRMIVQESALNATAQTGATYLFESWYLAREDINIYNSMATKTVAPTFTGGTWSLGSGTNYRLGPAIDRWVPRTNPPANSINVEIAGSEGHVQVAVKAIDLGNGTWRYHYAVMNHDFARAVTECLDPVPGPTCRPGYLKVVHNYGLDRFRVTTAAGVTITSVAFSDGDTDAANDWTGTVAPTAVDWVAPANPSPPAGTPAVLNPLNWGTMFRFSFVADAAPSPAGVQLHIAQAGTGDDPAFLSTTVLAPGAGDSIFVDGFETAAKR